MPAIYLDDCALAALAHALERVALEAQIARDIRLAGHSTWGGCAAPAARSAGAPSPLQSSVLPSISMHDYVRRIHRHFRCSGVCLYFALAYILRLARLDSPQVQVSEMSIHRLFLCGAVVAAKVLDDRYYSNKYYARVGGVRLDSLNEAELCFLKALEFRALVSESELEEAMLLADPASSEDEVGSVSSSCGLGGLGSFRAGFQTDSSRASPAATPAGSPGGYVLHREFCAGIPVAGN